MTAISTEEKNFIIEAISLEKTGLPGFKKKITELVKTLTSGDYDKEELALFFRYCGLERMDRELEKATGFVQTNGSEDTSRMRMFMSVVDKRLKLHTNLYFGLKTRDSVLYNLCMWVSITGLTLQDLLRRVHEGLGITTDIDTFMIDCLIHRKPEGFVSFSSF